MVGSSKKKIKDHFVLCRVWKHDGAITSWPASRLFKTRDRLLHAQAETHTYGCQQPRAKYHATKPCIVNIPLTTTTCWCHGDHCLRETCLYVAVANWAMGMDAEIIREGKQHKQDKSKCLYQGFFTWGYYVYIITRCVLIFAIMFRTRVDTLVPNITGTSHYKNTFSFAVWLRMPLTLWPWNKDTSWYDSGSSCA